MSLRIPPKEPRMTYRTIRRDPRDLPWLQQRQPPEALEGATRPEVEEEEALSISLDQPDQDL